MEEGYWEQWLNRFKHDLFYNLEDALVIGVKCSAVMLLFGLIIIFLLRVGLFVLEMPL